MKRPIFALSTALTFFAGPALAHTGAGPASGLAAGFSHPIMGLDHVLAMVAVGLLAAQLGGRARWAVPAAFVAAMVVASVAAVNGVALPLVEFGIAGSVIVLGAAIAFGRRLPVAGAMALVGVFALFHGHAHGTEMPATVAGLTYGLGFVAATAGLHVAGLGLATVSIRASARLAPLVLRIGGALVAAAGLVLASA